MISSIPALINVAVAALTLIAPGLEAPRSDRGSRPPIVQESQPDSATPELLGRNLREALTLLRQSAIADDRVIVLSAAERRILERPYAESLLAMTVHDSLPRPRTILGGGARITLVVGRPEGDGTRRSNLGLTMVLMGAAILVLFLSLLISLRRRS